MLVFFEALDSVISIQVRLTAVTASQGWLYLAGVNLQMLVQMVASHESL
jgi:mannose/fructose-specific phosphotransferase system component IIA